MSPASPLLNACKHLMSCPYFLLEIVLGLNVTQYKDTVTFSCENSNFVENAELFPHMLSLKKPHHTILGVLHPASSLHVVLWHLHFMGKKINPKCQHSFYITTDILQKCHYWVCNLFLFIHEWIMLELTWAIVHYLLFLWIWCLAKVLKVWCFLNVIHFLLLCILLAKITLSPLFCYCCFGIMLKIREILKLFQVIS